MKEVIVTIEERLVRDITVNVPDEVNKSDILNYAENVVLEKYKKSNIILDAEDFVEARMSSKYHDDNTKAIIRNPQKTI